MSLNWIGQDDFSVGWLDGVGQDQLPGVGLERAYNAVFNDDGDCYRRGALQSLAAISGQQLQFIWSGWLGGVYRGLVASLVNFYAYDLGGVYTNLANGGLSRPVKPAVVGELIFFPSGFTWGGSTKFQWAAGTITTTVGSPIVVGVGTNWVAGNIEAGMIFQRTGGAYHRIKSVEDATHLTLDTPSAVAVAGATYTAYGTTLAAGVNPPAGVLPAGTRHLGAIFNRLVVASGSVICFSRAGDPFVFGATDFHKLPDGVSVVGLATIRDTLLVFTDAGLWSITGMAFELTDAAGNPQQTLQRLTPEISLVHESGLADWAGMIVVPCTDRVFLVDGLAPPVPVSDSIQPAYSSRFFPAYTIGGAAVFRNHYFLPWIISGGSWAPVDLFVCRLNRPVQSRQIYYGWSKWTRKAAQAAAFAADTRAAPILRAAGGLSNNIIDFTETMDPFDLTDVATSAPVADYGQVAVSTSQIEFDVIVRDIPTGTGQPNHIRRMRVGYEARGGGQVKAAYAYGSEPTTYQRILDRRLTYTQLAAQYATYATLLTGSGTAGAEWATPDGRGWNVLDPVAVQTGVDPIQWYLPHAERVRYIAGRIRVTDPLTTFTLRKLQFAIRAATHQR